MPSSFLSRFRRVSRSTAYLPEVDGLRFLAVFLVVVVLHIPNYLDREMFGGQLLRSASAHTLVMGGGYGVSLFFVISGFILSLPFARTYLLAGPEVRLRQYYLRRLTRLEPPYLLALLLFFAGYVWILRQYTAGALFPHLLASVFYMHNLVYGQFSLVLPVAWSLEVEVQFYLLAPLLCQVFRIRDRRLRRGLLSGVILSGLLFWFDDWSIPHVFQALHFFAAGLLLTDLYLVPPAARWRQVPLGAGIAAGLLFLLLPFEKNFWGYLGKLAGEFVLFYGVLTNPRLRRWFSAPLPVLIGGMCYSIYLLHFGIISCTGLLLRKAGAPVDHAAYALLYGALMVVGVLAVSAIYFLLVEKPFMRWKLRPEEVRGGHL